MKKWLQNATTTNPTFPAINTVNQMNQSHSSLTIRNTSTTTNDSVEYQARRLADLALLFGLYQYAHQLYQSLKKDFSNDQAYVSFMNF